MVEEYSARAVTTRVIEHLERRRAAIVDSDEAVRAEITSALEPIRKAYQELELPPSYLKALVEEIDDALPIRWRRAAQAFTRLEQTGFGAWRGGDVAARISFVGIGFIIGLLCLRAPFIPIWEKWFPFALAVAAWWLPDVQRIWHRRRYARELGEMVTSLGSAQRALDERITMGELLPPGENT